MSCIFAYHSKENDGAIHIPCNVVVHDIVVKVKPRRSVLPMSMVDLVNAKTWDLWIVNAQDILRGICFLLLCCMGGFSMCFGWDWSHGGPM